MFENVIALRLFLNISTCLLYVCLSRLHRRYAEPNPFDLIKTCHIGTEIYDGIEVAALIMNMFSSVLIVTNDSLNYPRMVE